MISFKSWEIRDYGKCLMVYVEIPKSGNMRLLKDVKDRLNNLTVPGLYLIENNHKAIERLGWEKMDDGLYYRLVE